MSAVISEMPIQPFFRQTIRSGRCFLLAQRPYADDRKVVTNILLLYYFRQQCEYYHL
jgi:hypothetical protein